MTEAEEKEVHRKKLKAQYLKMCARELRLLKWLGRA